MFAPEFKVKMIAPDGEIGVRYYGKVVSHEDGQVLVEWEHGSRQKLPQRYFIPDDQPHEDEFLWIQEQINRLKGELERAQSKLQLACSHDSKYRWALLEDGGRIVDRCSKCKKTFE